MALNRATATRDEVQATQKVTEAMKLINKDISVDKVDAMMYVELFSLFPSFSLFFDDYCGFYATC